VTVCLSSEEEAGHCATEARPRLIEAEAQASHELHASLRALIPVGDRSLSTCWCERGVTTSLMGRRSGPRLHSRAD